MEEWRLGKIRAKDREPKSLFPTRYQGIEMEEGGERKSGVCARIFVLSPPPRKRDLKSSGCVRFLRGVESKVEM